MAISSSLSSLNLKSNLFLILNYTKVSSEGFLRVNLVYVILPLSFLGGPLSFNFEFRKKISDAEINYKRIWPGIFNFARYEDYNYTVTDGT